MRHANLVLLFADDGAKGWQFLRQLEMSVRLLYAHQRSSSITGHKLTQRAMPFTVKLYF